MPISVRKWLCAFGGICLSLFFVTISYGLTLHEVVQHTVQTNPTVWESSHARQASKESVGVARAGFMPVIDLDAALGPEDALNPITRFRTTQLSRKEFGVGLRQMLFDAFGTLNDLKRAKYKTVADAYAVAGSSNDQAILAIEAYLDILQNRRLVQIARDHLRRIVAIYNLVKTRHEAGLARKADLYQGQSRVQLARTNLFTIQNDLYDALTAFKRVTGMKPKGLVMPKDVPMKRLPRTLRISIEQAIDANPKLKSALADVAEAEYQYRASKSVNFPRVDFIAGLDRDTNVGGLPGPNEATFFLFRLSYNLFNGFGDISRQRENAYEVDQAADIRNRTLRELIESIRFAWYSILTTNERVPALALRKRAAFGTVKLYKEQFKLGRRTLLDLLDSENELFNSRVSYTREKYLLEISKYRLLENLNQLLPYLNVGLPLSATPPYKERLVMPRVFPDPGIVNNDALHITQIQRAELNSSRHSGPFAPRDYPQLHAIEAPLPHPKNAKNAYHRGHLSGTSKANRQDLHSTASLFWFERYLNNLV